MMQHKHLKPLYWGLFSVGGTTAALFLAPLVLLMCVLLPMGVLGNTDTFYRNANAWLRHWWLYLPLTALVFTFLWHGVHRFYYILHDIHIHVGAKTRWVFYVFAVTAFVLTLIIGLWG